MKNLTNPLNFCFKPKSKMVSIQWMIWICKINIYDTHLTDFQFSIWSRFITPNDLHGFPLIIPSDASFKPLQVINKTLPLLVIPLLNQSPSTRILYVKFLLGYFCKFFKNLSSSILISIGFIISCLLKFCSPLMKTVLIIDDYLSFFFDQYVN